MNARIKIPTEEVAKFCQRNHILRLALFGSVLRDDFTPESDVDVLGGIRPACSRWLLRIGENRDGTGRSPGTKGALTSPSEVSRVTPNWLLRKEILNSTETIFEQAG